MCEISHIRFIRGEQLRYGNIRLLTYNFACDRQVRVTAKLRSDTCITSSHVSDVTKWESSDSSRRYMSVALNDIMRVRLIAVPIYYVLILFDTELFEDKATITGFVINISKYC